MGKLIAKQIRGMNLWAKVARTLPLTFALTVFASIGAIPDTVTAALNSTTTGTVVVSSSNTSLQITAPYTDDANGNNTLKVEWGTGGTYTLGNQTLTHSASPYSYTISGLTASTAYNVRVTYQDADTVTGTAVQTFTPSTTAFNTPLMHNAYNVNPANSKGYGANWGSTFTCETCHAQGSSNVKLVAAAVATPNGSRAVVFTRMTSTSDTLNGVFGNDARQYSGNGTGGSANICEVCHRKTTFHRYSTNAPTLTHYNNRLCLPCHPHSAGFKGSGHTVPLYATSTGHTGCASGIGCHANSNPAAPYPNGGNPPDCRSCHAKGDPTTANIGCGSCHGAAAGTGEPNGSAHPDAVGSHPKHTSLQACTYCHDVGGTGGNADHGKGNRGANPAVVNLAASLSWSATTSQCSTTTCHANVYGTGSIVSPAWGTASGCSACHTTYPIGADGPVTGSHTAHTGNACTNCHNAGTTSTTAPGTAHGNGTVDVVNVGYLGTGAKHAANSGYSACSTASCHHDGTDVATAVVATVTTPTWGTASGCNICHGVGGTNGAPSYPNLKEVPLAAAGTTWTTPTNALLEDGVFATYAGTAQGTLILTNFNYLATDVADTDTVTGITVVVKGWAASATAPGNQLSVQLTQNGSAGVGTAKTISLPGTTAAANNEVVVNTTPTDLWGATWTPAQIRATTFGVIVKDNDTANSQLNVDVVKVIVHTDKSRKMNSHAKHSAYTCEKCHFSTTSTGTTITDASKHNNGFYNVSSSTKQLHYAYSAVGGTCTNIACHGTAIWGVDSMDCVSCHTAQVAINNGPLAGSGQFRRAIQPEFTKSWSHKASGGRTVVKADCIVCHMEGDKTSQSVTSLHGDGYINLRNADDGLEIKPVTGFSGTPGSYAIAASGNASFARFTRNLGVTLESDPNWLTIAAIQVNHCLSCHDSNGATNANAQVPTSGTQYRPFGYAVASTGTYYLNNIAAGNGTSNVVDVKSSFNTANASYHPVLGKGNNGFIGGTMMKAPWNGTLSPAKPGSGATTVYGFLISCWDCHADSTDAWGNTTVQTSTVTAHGNGTTVRGGMWVATTNLCTKCHADQYGTTSSQHGTGSALQTGNSNIGNNTNLCWNCHSSYNNSRPWRGVDAHGFDTIAELRPYNTSLTAAGAAVWGVNATYGGGNKPWAFIRTSMLSAWRPAKGTGLTDAANGSCGGSANQSPCSNTHQTYTPGGWY